MRGGRHSRYTVYDVMDAKGVFDDNSANSTSPRYAGPVEYPKMYYHPSGKQRVIQKAEILNTPFGPVKVGEQFELISRTVNDASEEERARKAGWHDHPAKAIEASGNKAPPMTAYGQIAELQRQIVSLQAQLNAAQASMPASPKDDFDVSEDDEIPEPEADELVADLKAEIAAGR